MKIENIEDILNILKNAAGEKAPSSRPSVSLMAWAVEESPTPAIQASSHRMTYLHLWLLVAKDGFCDLRMPIHQAVFDQINRMLEFCGDGNEMIALASVLNSFSTSRIPL